MIRSASCLLLTAALAAPEETLLADLPCRGHTCRNGRYTGDAELAADGSAVVQLEQTLHGKDATGLRGALAEMPAQQVRDAVETRLVGNALPPSRRESASSQRCPRDRLRS